MRSKRRLDRKFIIGMEVFSYDQIREKIIEIIKGRELTAKEIAAELGVTYEKIRNIVPAMARKNTIQSNGGRTDCRYCYTKPCGLQNILRPLPDALKNLAGTVYNEDSAKHNTRFNVPYESYGVMAHYQND